MAKISKTKRRSGLVQRQSRAQQAIREVEATELGSLEALAHYLMVENPDLMGGTPESIAAAVGVSPESVSYLLNQSREFQVLLDWHVVGGSWGIRQRQSVYASMVGRMKDPETKLGEVVRAAEYFDKKAGIAPSDSQGRQGTVIQIAVVQEGDGEWEPTHSPLRFGGEAQGHSGAYESTGRVLTADEVIDVESTSPS